MLTRFSLIFTVEHDGEPEDILQSMVNEAQQISDMEAHFLDTVAPKVSGEWEVLRD
jgi:hypothetical protein